MFFKYLIPKRRFQVILIIKVENITKHVGQITFQKGEFSRKVSVHTTFPMFFTYDDCRLWSGDFKEKDEKVY